jgi:hypothetical protein
MRVLRRASVFTRKPKPISSACGRYLRAVLKRTNVFQEVVAIIQEHLAGDASVEESGMLVHRYTDEPVPGVVRWSDADT